MAFVCRAVLGRRGSRREPDPAQRERDVIYIRLSSVRPTVLRSYPKCPRVHQISEEEKEDNLGGGSSLQTSLSPFPIPTRR